MKIVKFDNGKYAVKVKELLGYSRFLNLEIALNDGRIDTYALPPGDQQCWQVVKRQCLGELEQCKRAIDRIKTAEEPIPEIVEEIEYP